MTDLGDSFIEQLSQFNPSTNVNDENANLPHEELLHNQKFLLNILSDSAANNSQFLSLIYGNLMDYDSQGNKLFFNGGNLDCFEKKQAWLAIDDGAVVNDTAFQSNNADKLLVYKGRRSYVDSSGEHGAWMERDFFIPQFLRGSELVLMMKGTGVYLNTNTPDVPFEYNVPYCNVSTIPNVYAVGHPVCLTPGSSGSSGTPSSPATTATPEFGACEPDLTSNCFARYEDIGVEVIGAIDETQSIEVVGPWPHHNLYAQQDDWLPEYRTVIVKFRIGKGTETIKVRIRRTRSDGAVAFSQMFLGGLPHPFDDYEITHADINEFYDFTNGITKWNVTTVNGRHVGKSCSEAKLPNLMTKEDWLCQTQFVKEITEWDWDQANGPRQNELEFASDVPFTVSKTHGMEFDPEFTRYAHVDMRVDGPDPGLAFMGVTFSISENDFSEDDTCDTTNPDDICGYVKFDIWTKVVNTNDFANPNFPGEYTRFTYNVPVLKKHTLGYLGYFEMYGNFYQNLTDSRGALVYVTISRDGESTEDTFNGNLTIVGTKMGLAVPPDDIKDPGTYTDIFVGGVEDCVV
jgi:hypothetical protein